VEDRLPGEATRPARELARYLLKSISMEDYMVRLPGKRRCRASLIVLMLSTAPHLLRAQAAAAPATPPPTVPDWALPGSATHKQVPPPADFHRPSQNFNTPIGVFEGQSDIGSAVAPGSASYDATPGSTPSIRPVTTSGTRVTSSAISGKRSPGTFPSRPALLSRTRTDTATARWSWSFAKISTTIPRKPWLRNTVWVWFTWHSVPREART